MVDHHPGFSGPAAPAPELHVTWGLSPHDSEKFLGVLSAQPDAARFERGGQSAAWICRHDHLSRREALACARQELASRLGARKRGTLAASGRPMSGMVLEPDRDHPADTALCFERGQFADRIRLTPGDLNGLRVLLSGVQGDLGGLRDRAAALVRDALGEVDPDIAGWALRNTDLAAAAHAAGYRLCDDDWRATAQGAGYVQDFLAGRLAELRAAGGSLTALEQQDALERVIEMLDPS
jgi:hypothetical protein